MVARVSAVIVDDLRRAGITRKPVADRDTVIAGALLHDIAKTKCIKDGGLHAEEGQLICNSLGYPEIGEIVAEHVILKTFADKKYRQGSFGAKELVFYGDKRVRHDQIVSLPQRLDYIIGRYGNNDAVRENHIRVNFEKAVEFEDYLFRYLSFAPDDLKQLLADSTVLKELNIRD